MIIINRGRLIRALFNISMRAKIAKVLVFDLEVVMNEETKSNDRHPHPLHPDSPNPILYYL